MKIFLSFLQSAQQHPIPAYDFWQYYIKNGIEEARHQWSECLDIDWALGLVPKSKDDHNQWKTDAWTKTVAWLKKHPADLFLSYLYPDQIDITAIHEIQKLGIPCVNFFCDNVRDFKKAPVEFEAFDLNWVPEYKAIKLYQKAGYKYINAPMPIWVDPRLRTLSEESNKQITFIGSKDIQRQLFFEELIQHAPQLPLAIYGKGWDENILKQLSTSANYTFNKKLRYQFNFIKKNGIAAYLRKLNNRNTSASVSSALKSKIYGSPGFDQYNHLIATSMITVGVNRYPSFHFPIALPDTYSRLRDIEAPMLGACYLTEYTEGIENLYDLKKEIETYKGPEDFIEKVNKLTFDHKQRNEMKTNGQKRALQDHSIPQSLNKILQRLSN
ncbi:MAG: hypothetical protein JWR67_1038 [Mucilaginibacter sp.]|nr:hypothetical protein [Mucilaginibacter sp.]